MIGRHGKTRAGLLGIAIILCLAGLSFGENSNLIDNVNGRYVKESYYFLEHPLPPGKNLVKNSSFEAGLKDWLVKFKVCTLTNGSDRYGLDETASVHGKRSLRLENPSSPCIAVLSPRFFPVKPEKDYTVSLYLKAEGDVAFSMSSVWWKKELMSARLASAWQRYHVTCKLPIASKDACILWFSFKGKGTVWVDAVQVEEGSMPSEYQPPKTMELAVTADKKLNLYRAGEPVNLVVTLSNGTEKNIETTVSYKIYDYLHNVVKQGQIPFSLNGNEYGQKTLSLNLNQKGYFKGIFELADDCKVKEEIAFGVFNPLSNKGVPDDDFFAIGPMHGFAEDNLDYGSYLHEVLGARHSNWYSERYPKPWIAEKSTREVIKYARKHDMDMILTVDTTAVPDYEKPETWTDEKVKTWTDFVYNTVSKYKEDVKCWWIGGEFVEKPDSAKTYVLLSKAAYEAAKNADPACKIISSAPYNSELIVKAHQWLFEAGGYPYFDIVALDCYCFDYPNPEAAGFAEKLDELRVLMRKYGGEKPVWITECGCQGHDFIYRDVPYDTPRNPVWTATELSQAENIVRQNIISLSRGIKRFVTFNLNGGGLGGAYYLGLLDNIDGASPKPALLAYNAMVSQIRGTTFVRELDPAKVIKCYQFENTRDKTGLFIVYNSDPDNREAKARLAVSPERLEANDMMGNPLDLGKGDESVLNLTGRPVYLKAKGGKASRLIRKALKTMQISGLEDLGVKISFDKEQKKIAVGLDNKANITLKGGKISLSIPPELGRLEKTDIAFTQLIPGQKEKFIFPLAELKPAPGREYYRVKAEVISELALKPTPPVGHPSQGGELTASAATGYDPLLGRGGVSRGGSEASFETGSTEVEYNGNTQVIVRDVSPARIICPFLNFQPVLDGDLEEWRAMAPHGLQNFRASQGKRQGADDLSVKYWLGYDKKNLYMAIEVTDDKFSQKYSGADMWQGDSIQVDFDLLNDAPAGYPRHENDCEFIFGLTDKGPQVFKNYPLNQRGIKRNVKLAVTRKDNKTCYEAGIPFSELSPWLLPRAGEISGFSFVVNDSDGEKLKGWLELTGGVAGGKNPGCFADLELGGNNE